MAVSKEAVVKCENYIKKMSQNNSYFNRRGVTKCQNLVVIVHDYVSSFYLNVEAAYFLCFVSFGDCSAL